MTELQAASLQWNIADKLDMDLCDPILDEMTNAIAALYKRGPVMIARTTPY